MSLVKYIKGDLFSSPKGSILGHSCNCQGVWGSGVAAIFKKQFPSAYDVYHNHCKQSTPDQLLGTCLLIPSRASDPGGADNYVACFFTSGHYGGKVDPPGMIVENTEKAVSSLLSQLPKDKASDPICIPKINAGLFRVPWDDTAAVLEKANHPFVVYEI